MNKLINISYKHYNKALDYINDNKISLAKEELEKAISIYGKDIDILNLIGLCEYMLCDFSKAYIYWMESIKYNDVDNKAIEYVNYLRTYEFKDLIKKYNAGLDYLQNKDYKKAIEVFENIINEYEDLVEPYEILFICNNNLNDKENANKYAENLNEIDKDNISNYEYLKLFNNEYKCRNKKSKKTTLISTIAIVGLLFESSLLYSFYKKYENEQSKNIEVEEKLQIINNNYELLVEDIEKQKYESKELKDILKLDSSESKKRIFNNAVNFYKNEDYKNAINGFECVVNNLDENEYIKSESIYFLAVSNEKIKDNDKSKKYYEEYINNYINYNFYDDALYNYGIILYKENNLEEAKEVLNKLKYECPESMFINSNTISILQK
ncbi:MAG: tetratricopeptide repeat protein [Bacilli bacterium]|nr:tetratricopeptide repeat protein [Bacilli bacterium]